MATSYSSECSQEVITGYCWLQGKGDGRLQNTGHGLELFLGFQRFDSETCNSSIPPEARGLLNWLFQKARRHHGITLTHWSQNLLLRDKDLRSEGQVVIAAVLLEPPGEILSLPSLPWLLPFQRPHLISKKSRILFQFPQSERLAVIFLYCTSYILPDKITQVKVSFYFSCHLQIVYKYDVKICTVHGTIDWTPQQYLICMHMWLQVGSYRRLLAVICSVVLFTALFCILRNRLR